MKILLAAINAKYIHSNPAVYSLRACTGAYRPYVAIAEYTINQPPDLLLRDIYQQRPDVIAFSCYIWNRRMLDQLIPDLHKLLPDTDIWAGGPEVSYDAANALRTWQLRGVMAGPGEATFAQLVSAYVDGRAEHLPQVLDSKNTPILPLAEIPFWYEDLTDFKNRIIYYESSRGCPFSCSYCLSSIERTMDFRPVLQVCKELDFFLEKKVPLVKFIDRTFNCKKEHALPILAHILEHDNGITSFHFEMAPDLLDEDYFSLLEKMRPGAVQLEIGVQSTHPETLAAIERPSDFAKTTAAIRRIRAWNSIHIHLDLIAGLPYEDLDTFILSFNDVYDLTPTQLQLGFLKVLKGSAMAQHAEAYRTLYTSQPPYEVLATRWLSYEDICKLKQVEEVLEIYYNSGQFTHTLRYLRPYFHTPYALYASLADWYEAHGLFVVQSSRIRKYEILLEFAQAKTDADRLVLRETLTYDLYLREHMKNRPAFALSQERWKNQIRGLLLEEAQTHTLFPDLHECSYRELTKLLHIEVFESICAQPTAVIFGYETRDPLTHNGMTVTRPILC